MLCLPDAFLAANTPGGFVSRMDQLSRESLDRLLIVKGTSGNGKSTLMRALAERVTAAGYPVERIHCSADPDSLDGVVFPSLRAAVVDGTAPHVVEPREPLAFETVVSLYDALDENAVYARREEVFEQTDRHKRLLLQAGRLIAAAGTLQNDSARMAAAAIDRPKLQKAAGRLARALFGKTTGVGEGTERVCFLSALSKNGVRQYADAAAAQYDTVYLLEDDVCDCGRSFLQVLHRAALAAGQPVTTCYCPMRPYEKLEHLLFPAQHTAFFTSGPYHRLSIPNALRINCRRFLQKPVLRECAVRLHFNRRAVRELLGEAAGVLGEAKHCHDLLERVYVDAMRPDVLAQKTAWAASVLGV